MLAKRLGILALATAAVSSAAMAAYQHHKTKPSVQCGIPCADYQYRSRSRPEMALSTTAVLVPRGEFETVEAPAIPPTQPSGPQTITIETISELGADGKTTSKRVERRIINQYEPDLTSPAQTKVTKQIKLYQLDRPQMQIDHCSVSRVAVQLHNDGCWAVSLRADQNPVNEDGTVTLTVEDGRYVAHLKRNQFFIKLRCYGTYKIDETRADASAGKPVLIELCPEPFWVQNGQPYDYFTRHFNCDVRTYYPFIDRVEVEFYYR